MPRLVCSFEFVVRRRKATHYPLPTTHMHSGFTLIEFLVVLGLLVMTVGSTLLFLTSILKGSNKANVTAEAKQNGQVVLDSIEKKVRNAINVTPIGTGLDRITLEQPDKNNIHLKCVSPRNASENGLIGIVQQASEPSTDDLYRDNPLTNKDPIAGVDITDCNFDVLGSSDGGTSPPIVTIRFTVNQGVLAPSRKDFVANVQMQTSIALRQYSQ